MPIDKFWDAEFEMTDKGRDLLEKLEFSPDAEIGKDIDKFYEKTALEVLSYFNGLTDGENIAAMVGVHMSSSRVAQLSMRRAYENLVKKECINRVEGV